MAIMRIGIQWIGWSGGPGYTNLHFTEFGGGGTQADAVARVEAFMDEISSLLPNDITLVMQSDVQIVDETTGQMTGFGDPISEPHSVQGSQSGNWSAPSGAIIHWNTNGVRNGKRVTGRTFIVPVGTSMYDSDGTLSNTAIGYLNDAADALVGDEFDSGFAVWARPGAAGPGAVFEVVGHRVPDKAVVLRSRRD